ncbi:class I SAM-dependent DNA methyltransferase [Cytobacillus sp. FJAT-54145]|uniref:Class I SAM-dependent DNA methyltransferase n=1 Tax=Cytobacillus spartinae TaxID=3299023 RepID=A0ABW6KI15_9BACI
MTYGKFAYLYDELMQDVPYDSWANTVLNKAKQYGIEGKKLLDLACGTGELSVRFAHLGFDVTGVDLSDDMLTVAHSKTEASGKNVSFFQQDMKELELADEFDIIGVFCDSLNYLSLEEDVQQTFRQIYKHLKQKGLFIFDVHSVYKITEVFADSTFTHDDEQICYIWSCFEGEHPYSVEHELTFFVHDEFTDKYDRYDELHTQRTYPITTYKKWLEESGFEILEITADFKETPPQMDSERILFVARKS